MSALAMNESSERHQARKRRAYKSKFSLVDFGQLKLNDTMASSVKKVDVVSTTTVNFTQVISMVNSGDHYEQQKHRSHRHLTLGVVCLWLYMIAICSTLAAAGNTTEIDLKQAPQLSPIAFRYSTANHSINFTHVTLDHWGNLYAGAANWLFRLNSSLALVESVRTGPIEDSPLCSPTDCSGVDEGSLQLRNNINKLLVVDELSSALLACGTVHQGTCRRYRLGAIAQVEDLTPIAVAANDENSSTLAFVGPARYHGGRITPILYVAVTNSRLGPYRDMVPAIASRSLEPGQRYLSVIEKSFTDTAKVDIEFHMKDYFLVHYVYGFAASDFVYFAAVQKRSHLRALEEWGYVSRLGRVCQSDSAYNTYVELTIECRGADGRNYQLLQDATLIEAGDELARSLRVPSRSRLLVGVFAEAIDHTSTPSSRSAVCIFTLGEIETKFAQNIHSCYNGSVNTRNMDYIAGNLPECPLRGNANQASPVSFCSETLKINGSIPLVRRAAIEFGATTLTAVAGHVTSSGYNVLFVGTAEGRLKKLWLAAPSLAEEFEELVIDAGHSILADMIIDQGGRYLIVVSPYVISKVVLEHCSTYNTCRACLGGRNPYCGWCSLQKSCTLRSQCTDTRSGPISTRWLSVDSNRCIEFQSIHPEHLPINSLDKVKLVINQLPRLPRNVTYQCVFGRNQPIEAEPMPNGLICQSPPVSYRPKFPEGQNFVSTDLAIRPSDSNTDFLQRKFTFYDCNFYKTCSSCVQSHWGCQWCFKENRCVSSGYLCGTHSANYSVPKFFPTATAQVIRTRESCPSFNLTTKQASSMALPNGVTREIALPVRNLAFGSVQYGCVISIEGGRNYVTARLESNQIICSPTAFVFKAERPTTEALVTAVWNKVNAIDSMNVTLYKCRHLGASSDRSDCSICLNLDRHYECAWCGNQCQHGSQCLETAITVCPPPRIDWIHPLSGPIQGGTLVTVEGSNLGTTMEEIRGKVMIGGYPCHVHSLNISVQFTCFTSRVLKPMLADVVVGNRAGFTTAKDKFLYSLPEALSAYPLVGPQSGGTRIYISGNNLAIGTTLEVFLDEYPCEVERLLASSTQISCRTSAAKISPYNVQRLYVKIDNATLALDTPFRYVPDPTVQRISPLKSYIAGGRAITVIGTGFDTIQQPRIGIFSLDGSFINETICEVLSATQMLCPSPPVSASLLDLIYREHQSLTTVEASTSSIHTSMSFMGGSAGSNDMTAYEKISFRVGFMMDAVGSVKDLSVNYPALHSDLIYVPDPKVYPFEEEIKEFKGDSLVLEGEHLRLATSESEINVTIGSEVCNITSLTQSQIFCLPPLLQPEPTDELGRRMSIYLPLVVVRIGNNIRFEAGYLRYESAKSYELSYLTIGFIVVFSVILFSFVLVSFVFMRHKSLLAEREYKRIQMQMDTLENSVRSECKQAFAELQTDMTDLSHDLEACGVPIQDHRTYVMKVFFPGVNDHPLFQQSTRRKTLGGPGQASGTTCAYNIYELAMAQFEQLLCYKPFLVCFINTLEARESFNIRDRVNVASLLMIILMERMDYATDILRTLLYQLVEKSVASKYPHLMLRRTESVVEKLLTNWLSLTMYDYMRNYAGGQLFLLFSAIKHQIEKGPIDVITHEARYSLSEERLLREHYCNYDQLTLVVFQPQRPLEKHHVRANDCDTIGQVKAKVLDVLFKNTPYSMKPSVGDFDMEWRDPVTSVHHMLLDIDPSSRREVHGASTWQRLNTLKHYGVKNMALVMLITKQHQQQQQQQQHQYHQINMNTMRSMHPQTGGAGNGTLYLTNGKSRSTSFYPLLNSPVSSNSLSACTGATTASSDLESGVIGEHMWHLVKPTTLDDISKESSSSSSAASMLMHKAIPEIFLTRLLSTKGTIQKYVDDFFRTILVANDALPISIKWVFDLLDESAEAFRIEDPEVVHAWKSNCLPLRFWVNFIKNPNFIVDVNKTPTVDSNLSVIAQTLMDSCSSADPRLGKDSPSSKLLFAKDIANYRNLVMQFYEDVYQLPAVSDGTLSSYMQSLNMEHSCEFDTVCALKELFVYAVKYNSEIIANLQLCDYATQQASLEKFINLINYKF